MPETIQRLDIQLPISELINLDNIIKTQLDSLINRCFNSIIITEIIEYKYEQKYINISSISCDLSFRIIFKCRYYRYYVGDVICLSVSGEKENTFDLSNDHCKSYMLKDLSNKILKPYDVILATIYDPVYPQNDQFVCRTELYTPNPVIYRVVFSGNRSSEFHVYAAEVLELLSKLATADTDKLYIQLGKDPISLDDIVNNNVSEFYLHLNNGNKLGLYKNINTDKEVKKLRLSDDCDYTILLMIRNYLDTISTFLRRELSYESDLFKYYDRIISSFGPLK